MLITDYRAFSEGTGSMNLKYMLTWAKWVDRNTRILREKKHGCQELLHSHHTLHKVIHVHISHFWGFCSCNAIMMLNLVSCKTHLSKSIKEYYIRYYIKIYLAHLKKPNTIHTSETAHLMALSLSMAHSFLTGPSGYLIRYRTNKDSAA